jgi:hypothetical protein
MDDDFVVRVPGRLRSGLTAIQREEYRRTPADTVRAIIEKAIFDRSIRRRPDSGQKGGAD